MCGRVSLTYDEFRLQERFNAHFNDVFKPRYNAAPTQNLPVILNTEPKTIQFVHWGLKPVWAKKKDGIINVRAETLIEKPTFKSDLKNRRCLVLADGFYEWKKEGTKKIPYRFRLKSEEPFAFAGIWEENTVEDKELSTFAIITTTANDLVGDVHNRMPVILKKDEERAWLQEDDVSLLEPFDAKLMKMERVSTLLNNPSIDRPEVLQAN